MKKYSDLEYLRLSKWNRFVYTLICTICAIPSGIVSLCKKIGLVIAKFFTGVKNEFVDIFVTFRDGDWKTRVSFVVMGFGNIARGQVLRGLLFLLMEVVFIVYMFFGGAYWMSMLPSLGKLGPVTTYDPILDVPSTTYNDNSFKILLYGVLTMFFIVGVIFTWRVNIKQNKISEQIIKSGKKLKSGKDDLRSLVDDKFHATLLSLPLMGILIFTVMPIIFMILVAFTNYDSLHNGYTNNLFTWVGMENFNTMLNWTGGNKAYAATFGEILAWTLMWAFFATFTNYFLGMFVAIMINKKGIKIKKFWRTVLVMTIAIPQFVSLLYVAKLFDATGIIGKLLLNWGLIPDSMIAANNLSLWSDPTSARILVIILNIWVGIPYIMLMATGILMNIPQDLYESARIDGASSVQQYTKITLPYMMFVMGPYLLTSFVGNLNNFNVIYLLTGGNPLNTAIGMAGGVSVGSTDLLITWLYKMTLNSAESKYYMASVIGILVFLVVAVLSLIVYNVIPSTKNEEDYS